MAKRRDIVVGVIIAVTFIMAVGFFGLMFISLLTGEGDLDFAGFGGNVGLVEMFGAITETSGRTVIKQIDNFADNKSIKAIIVHINSPGGEVAISQEVYSAINRAREKKPVVAAMASVAASGGYYIACAADRIVANPGTLTGSIGVIFQFHTFQKLMDKLGIGTETVKSGEFKDVGSYSRSMTKKEELMLRAVIMDAYQQFVQAVSEGRGMEIDDIYPLADGSIFTGQQAYSHGLVDTLGGLQDAIDLAAELAEIEGKPKIVRYPKRKQWRFFDLLTQLLDNLNGSVTDELTGPQLMYLYQ
ncbi:MAG: signal peptide peptidase SppA [Candidatus Zixiibacteriota bacterium]